jgi:midasin
MSLVGHLRDPLSLNPKSQWLAFTSKLPDCSSTSQSNLVDTSPGEVLSLASKFLLLPSCTAIVADTFRPLLLDLCARWLETSEALEDKLSALCFLLQPHTEIFPYVFFGLPTSSTLTILEASFPPSSNNSSLNLAPSLQSFRLFHLKRPLYPNCMAYSLHTIVF